MGEFVKLTMSTEKRYRLKQIIVTPEGYSPHGTEAQWNSGNYFIPYHKSNGGYYLNVDQVEENPDWFELITEEEKTEQTFAWDEKLVKEFVKRYSLPQGRTDGRDVIQKHIDEFIKSKSPSADVRKDKDWQITAFEFNTQIIKRSGSGLFNGYPENNWLNDKVNSV